MKPQPPHHHHGADLFDAAPQPHHQATNKKSAYTSFLSVTLQLALYPPQVAVIVHSQGVTQVTNQV